MEGSTGIGIIKESIVSLSPVGRDSEDARNVDLDSSWLEHRRLACRWPSFPALTTVWVGTGRMDDYGSAQIQSLFPDNEGRQPFRPESCLGEGIPFNPETGHQVPGYFVNGDGRR
jgi:hypothetical protein